MCFDLCLTTPAKLRASSHRPGIDSGNPISHYLCIKSAKYTHDTLRGWDTPIQRGVKIFEQSRLFGLSFSYVTLYCEAMDAYL